MKHFTPLLLAVTIIITLASVTLVSTHAYTDNSDVEASVPPDNKFEPIRTINIRNDTSSHKDKYLCDNPDGSVEMKRVDDKHYQYTFTDLAPGKQFLFNFCVNNDYVDRFGRGADQTDYGFDVPTRIFRYPHGYNPPSNPLNLTEPNITVPPDGYTYDVTVSLDLTYTDTRSTPLRWIASIRSKARTIGTPAAIVWEIMIRITASRVKPSLWRMILPSANRRATASTISAVSLTDRDIP